MNSERLIKLATHLESGKLGHDVFDFGVYHDENSCGTLGCAIGECPYAFPDEWEMRHGCPVLIDTSHVGEQGCSKEFFYLDDFEFTHLFAPGLQRPERYGGINLYQYSTRYEVAKNIRDFVQKKQSQEKACAP